MIREAPVCRCRNESAPRAGAQWAARGGNWGVGASPLWVQEPETLPTASPLLVLRAAVIFSSIFRKLPALLNRANSLCGPGGLHFIDEVLYILNDA